MKIGIAGLGLIGGSIAKAYKAKTDNEILGFDSDKSVIEIAKIYGAVDDSLTLEKVSECDCIIIALHPDASIDYLKEIAPKVNSSALVIDCCGTKEKICNIGFALAKEYGFTFVGGHPMAGTHYSSFRSSREDLFRNAGMVIVPPVYDDIILLERVKKTLAPIGFAQFSVTTAEKHDKIIAFTSQMAHVVSNAYIKSPSAPSHKGVSAGSYKDLTRVAWLNPEMWTELFMDNKTNLLFELNFFINSLCEYRDAIETGDKELLRKLLDDGRKRKEEVDG